MPAGARHRLARAGGTVKLQLVLHGVLGFAFAVTFLEALVSRGRPARWTAAKQALGESIGTSVWLSGAALAVAGLFGLWAAGRRPNDRSLRAVAVSGLVVVLFVFAHPLGRHAGLVWLALAAALSAGAIGGRSAGRKRTAEPGESGVRRDRITGGILFVLAVVPMAIFSMHRHWAFGSGSWDMGCEVHNAYRTSRFLPTLSTVLGEVDFIGDHFLVGFYLYAPYFWLWTSAYSVLLLQALHLAVTGPAVFAIARHHGASRTAAAALGVVTSLSFGMQAAAFFDAHEITLGFGFFAVAIWALETRRWVWASVAAAIFCAFKESVGLYVVGLGLWVWVRSISTDDRLVRPADRRLERWIGTAWVFAGLAVFVLVNRLIMPWFQAHGNPPEPHETFADFGPDVFRAALAILQDPLRAAWVALVPEMKLESIVVTLANAGWLSVLSPSVGVAALPLVAERFLSSKMTMWQMGYHYAAPLCLYAGWAAARRLGRVERWVQERFVRSQRYASGWAVAGFLVAMGLGVTAYGTYEPSNFWVWRYPYYSSPEKRTANRAAVRLVQRRAPRGRVAAQNHILPHLAARAWIYRLADHRKADWVVLSEGENAWPYPKSYPEQLRRRLGQDPRWNEVFSESGTFVFRRLKPQSP